MSYIIGGNRDTVGSAKFFVCDAWTFLWNLWAKDYFSVYLVAFLVLELSRSSENAELGRHEHKEEEAKKKSIMVKTDVT